jgi:hypothetical protein
MRQRSGRSWFKTSLCKYFHKTLSQKKNLHKNKAGGVAQVKDPVAASRAPIQGA